MSLCKVALIDSIRATPNLPKSLRLGMGRQPNPEGASLIYPSLPTSGLLLRGLRLPIGETQFSQVIGFKLSKSLKSIATRAIKETETILARMQIKTPEQAVFLPYEAQLKRYKEAKAKVIERYDTAIASLEAILSPANRLKVTQALTQTTQKGSKTQ